MQKALQSQANAASGSAGSSSKHKPGVGHKDGSSSKAGATTRKDGTRGTKRGREEVSVPCAFVLLLDTMTDLTCGLVVGRRQQKA